MTWIEKENYEALAQIDGGKFRELWNMGLPCPNLSNDPLLRLMEINERMKVLVKEVEER